MLGVTASAALRAAWQPCLLTHAARALAQRPLPLRLASCGVAQRHAHVATTAVTTATLTTAATRASALRRPRCAVPALPSSSLLSRLPAHSVRYASTCALLRPHASLSSSLQQPQHARGGVAYVTAYAMSRRGQYGGAAQQPQQMDYYAVLGVRADATADEIKSAYKKLALQYHPDRNHDAGAEERFKNISAAYNVVGHKERRREYDAQRAMFGGHTQGSYRSSSGDAGSASSSGGSYGYTPPYGSGASASSGGYTQYQQMSKEDADRLFREIFGGLRVDQIFRNMEAEMQRSGIGGAGSAGAGAGGGGGLFGMGNSGGRLGSHVGESFTAHTFRPFFASESSSTRIVVDGNGNRMEETTYVDTRGKRFTVRRVTSSSSGDDGSGGADGASAARGVGGAGMSSSSYTRHRIDDDGRVRFGASSARGSDGRASASMPDLTQTLLGLRGASRAQTPGSSLLLAGAWAVVLTTLIYCTLHLVLHHPVFAGAVLLIWLLGRRNRRRFL